MFVFPLILANAARHTPLMSTRSVESHLRSAAVQLIEENLQLS